MFFGYCISLEKVLQLAHERSQQIKIPVDESRDVVIIYRHYLWLSSVAVFVLNHFLIIMIILQNEQKNRTSPTMLTPINTSKKHSISAPIDLKSPRKHLSSHVMDRHQGALMQKRIKVESPGGSSGSANHITASSLERMQKMRSQGMMSSTPLSISATSPASSLLSSSSSCNSSANGSSQTPPAALQHGPIPSMPFLGGMTAGGLLPHHLIYPHLFGMAGGIPGGLPPGLLMPTPPAAGTQSTPTAPAAAGRESSQSSAGRGKAVPSSTPEPASHHSGPSHSSGSAPHERNKPQAGAATTSRPQSKQPHPAIPALPAGPHPPFPPGLMPPMPPFGPFPPPHLPPGMMPPPGLSGPGGILPPSTLMVPYPVLIPFPLPIPIVLPVKTDNDVSAILNMYSKKSSTTMSLPPNSTHTHPSSARSHGNQTEPLYTLSSTTDEPQSSTTSSSRDTHPLPCSPSSTPGAQTSVPARVIDIKPIKSECTGSSHYGAHPDDDVFNHAQEECTDFDRDDAISTVDSTATLKRHCSLRGMSENCSTEDPHTRKDAIACACCQTQSPSDVNSDHCDTRGPLVEGSPSKRQRRHSVNGNIMDWEDMDRNAVIDLSTDRSQSCNIESKTPPGGSTGYRDILSPEGQEKDIDVNKNTSLFSHEAGLGLITTSGITTPLSLVPPPLISPFALGTLGQSMPTADSAYSARRGRILDAPSVPRDRKRSPTPERRVMVRGPSREVLFAKRRVMRARIKTK